MTRSLTFKWSVTLLLSSLVGVVLVGLFAYRTTINEFDRLRMEQARNAFITQASEYYVENGSWEGLNNARREENAEPSSDQGDPGPGHKDDNPPQMFALANADGEIVVESGPFRFGEQATAEQIESGIPITIDDVQVGTVLIATPPPDLDPREQMYLDRTNQALLVGAIGASAVALLVGIVLSRNFLKPLSELQKAISAMQQGNLNQQVQVRTRDEIGILATTFNQMSAEIHRANQLRQQVTADIAHDLRTPLLVIAGYLEALVDGTLKPTPARFKAMQDEANLLKRLVEDLRTLSLADAGELKLILQSIPPGELLEKVKQSFEPIAKQQHVSLSVQTDAGLPDLVIDRERMMQVLANLVTNALRYTPEGGNVILQAQKRQNGVQLLIKDTGAGIPEDKLPNIFERFYRIEESRYQSEGESGLGLAIAKSIVEAHGGSISATSRLGEGTTMMIALSAS